MSRHELPTDAKTLLEICQVMRLPDCENQEAAENLLKGIYLLHANLKTETWQQVIQPLPLIFHQTTPEATNKLLYDSPPSPVFSPHDLTGASNTYNFLRRGYAHTQQDSLLIKEKGYFHFYAVADGLGGLEGSEQASRYITNALKSAQFKNPFGLYDALVRAIQNFPEPGKPIGTTLSLALQEEDGQWFFLSIGDSPITIFSPNTLPACIPNDAKPDGSMYTCIQSNRKKDLLSMLEQKWHDALFGQRRLPPQSTLIIGTDGINPFFQNLPEAEISRLMLKCNPKTIGLMMQAYVLLLSPSCPVDNHTAIIRQFD